MLCYNITSTIYGSQYNVTSSTGLHRPGRPRALLHPAHRGHDLPRAPAGTG